VEIVNKNGGRPLSVQKEIAIETRARIYPVTPDGSQWELRVHFESNVGAGKEIIGECVLRSFNGGITPLVGMMQQASQVAPQLVDRVVKGMAAAQEEAAHRVVLASAMPHDLKQ
jgi:hypothetical protein